MFISGLPGYSVLAGIAFIINIIPLIYWAVGRIGLCFAFVINSQSLALIAAVILSIIVPEEFAV